MVHMIAIAIVVKIFTSICVFIVGMLFTKLTIDDLEISIDINRKVLIIRSIIQAVIMQCSFALSFMYNFMIALIIIEFLFEFVPVLILVPKMRKMYIIYSIMLMMYLVIYYYGGKNSILISFIGCSMIQSLIYSFYHPTNFKQIISQKGE